MNIILQKIKKLSLLIINCTLLIVNFTLLYSCSSPKNEVSSPDGRIKVAFNTNIDGEMFYNVKVDDSIFINDSQLGFEAKEGLNLKNSFEIIKTEFSSKDKTWEQIWRIKSFATTITRWRFTSLTSTAPTSQCVSDSSTTDSVSATNTK